MMTKYYIGFANKYYTLWQCSEESQDEVKYTYMKNLSMDKEKAEKKAEEYRAEFNEILRGRTKSFAYSPRKDPEPNKFHCGKYSNVVFSDCTDYKYMHWFFNNAAEEIQKESLLDVLSNYGYQYDESRNYLLTPEEVQFERDAKQIFADQIKVLSEGNPYKLECLRSLDGFGEYLDRDKFTIFVFPNYKICDYYGMEYGMPIDDKGRAKRIKNKTLLLIDYTMTYDDYEIKVIVNQWKMLK